MDSLSLAADRLTVKCNRGLMTSLTSLTRIKVTCRVQYGAVQCVVLVLRLYYVCKIGQDACCLGSAILQPFLAARDSFAQLK